MPTDEGQWAFVPNALPRQMELDSSLVYLLDNASRAVATLAGIGETLPNPHLLVQPFLRREAVLSSRIEGTQASISDLLLFEVSGARQDRGDAQEVANYVYALEEGLDLLEKLPVCVRLINQVHERLLQGVRGQERTPGALRTAQNWIGSRGTPIQEARFIPPPAGMIRDLLSDWEAFVNEELEMPPLVRCAVAHYQFEAIHPYFDGNGRIGRLLVPLCLSAEGVLPEPLLYLSAYFQRNRHQYYDHLYDLSVSGEWGPWLRFFLVGVAEQARDAAVRARRVRQLQERYRDMLQERRESANGFRLLDTLFVNPFTTIPAAHRVLGITRAGARRVVERLCDAEILEYVSGSWPKFYVARELLRVIEQPLSQETTAEE